MIEKKDIFVRIGGIHILTHFTNSAIAPTVSCGYIQLMDVVTGWDYPRTSIGTVGSGLCDINTWVSNLYVFAP